LNLSWVTHYSDWGFLWCSSVFPNRCQD